MSPARGATVYLGKDATEDRVREEAGTYRILHLAAHGIYDRNSPMDSGILLAQLPGQKDDGIWNARDHSYAALVRQLRGPHLSTCP